MSSILAGTKELAGRYAAALFDLAEDAGLLDEVAGDLQEIETMIAESADIDRLIRSPLFSRDDQGRAMAAVLEKAGLSALTRNFVGVVCHNRRLFMLPQMTGAYLAKLAERRGEVTADAISAAPLTEQQTAALADSVRRLVGGSVTLDVEVDCSLLGGLIVKVGSRMFDSSLKTKLQRMKLAMKGIG